MIDLLLEIKEVVDKHKIEGSDKQNPETIKLFEEKYAIIVENVYAANPPPEEEMVKKRCRKSQSKTKNMLDRLSNHQHEALAFMHKFNVPFDNNQALSRYKGNRLRGIFAWSKLNRKSLGFSVALRVQRCFVA